MTNVIKNTKQWFEKAVPEPTEENIHAQIGVHLEEVVEMLDELKSENPESMVLIGSASLYLHRLSTALKQQKIKLIEPDKVMLLDAICDQLVTATGVAHMYGMDIIGGLHEVNESNYSKFDEDGNPIFNENKKIVKGSNYFKPNLAKYV